MPFNKSPQSNFSPQRHWLLLSTTAAVSGKNYQERPRRPLAKRRLNIFMHIFTPTQLRAHASKHHPSLWMVLLALVILVASQAPLAQPTVALTFDDGFSTGPGETQEASDNNAILTTLKKNGVRAMLFPLGATVDNPDNMALIKAWSKGGHAIGNHTYSHNALSKTEAQHYLADIDRAGLLLSHIPGWCPRLRFPYLDEGDTPTKQIAVRAGLAQRGYGVAPATIMLNDWDTSTGYTELLNQGRDAEAQTYLNTYVNTVTTEALTQEVRWHDILKRSPPHVMLLHTNRLNAVALPQIIAALRQRGWSFIDPVVALTDPIYQRELGQTLPGQDRTALPVPNCR